MTPSKKQVKERLDKLLVDKELCKTRSQAQQLIMAGNVKVNNQMIDKPGTLCCPSDSFNIKETLRYVSRGGLKLEKALSEFDISIKDRICLDAGASTGGFTDCMLQHGATLINAVDVGYGQLDWRLRQDPHVILHERTHILKITPEQLKPKPTLATVDLSFISLKKVLPHIASCLMSYPEQGQYAEIIALVKPQFEYLDYCSKKNFKGVVNTSEDLEKIITGLAEDLSKTMPGWKLIGFTESPIKGQKGNREFFFYFHHGNREPVTLDEIVYKLIQTEQDPVNC